MEMLRVEVPQIRIYNNCMLDMKMYQVEMHGQAITGPLTLEEAIKAIRDFEKAFLSFHPGKPIPYVLQAATEGVEVPQDR